MLSQQEKDAVLQIHTDHLGTPRAVSSGNTVLWRWEGEAFGDSAANEQVAGPSRKFTMPLRFPGQYYDQETGLNYNYFRDYNPATGRYIESDPIGLRGGINTYAYVGGGPINLTDPLGLVTVIVINNNPTEVWSPFAGTHAGMYVSNGGSPMLYDPGGSYTDNLGGGAGNFVTDEQANLTSYLQYQLKDGPHLQTYMFNTTPEEEAAIVETITNGPNYGPGQCAAGVSNALNGIGPFRNLGIHNWPRRLESALNALPGKK